VFHKPALYQSSTGVAGPQSDETAFGDTAADLLTRFLRRSGANSLHLNEHPAFIIPIRYGVCRYKIAGFVATRFNQATYPLVAG